MLSKREYIREYKRAARLDAIKHYSPSLTCQRCGFSDFRALSIDHIHGGGVKHINSINFNLYFWLRKNNYPEGFQVLCMNCQFIKARDNNETTHINKHAKPERYVEQQKEYYKKIRRMVIEHYSPDILCVRCKEKDYRTLTLDHIKGDGYLRRRRTGSSSNNDIWWIVKNNYPKIYQILCMNCNVIKRIENKEF
jgi:hypothetical protein